jgi:hypothetical protein
MIELACGLIIGAVMGLTGAGGALVAIPLFMQFMHQDLKQASLYSLVAVVIASVSNFIAQKKFTQYRTGIVIILASVLGSFVTASFKQLMSSFWIALLLASVSLYALYSIWFPRKGETTEGNSARKSDTLSVIIGLALGALTTFTGLGGGVLMLPVLMRFYRHSQEQAVATSLFSVGLSSLFSLGIQVSRGADFSLGPEFVYLMLGILTAAYLLKIFGKKIAPWTLTNVRKIVFSIVVAMALLKIF